MSYHWIQIGPTIKYEIGGFGKKMAHGGHSTLYLGSIIAFTADFMVHIARSEAPFQRQYYPIFKGRMNIYTKNKFHSFIFLEEGACYTRMFWILNSHIPIAPHISHKGSVVIVFSLTSWIPLWVLLVLVVFNLFDKFSFFSGQSYHICFFSAFLVRIQSI